MACLLFVWSGCNIVPAEANDTTPEVRISLEANNEPLNAVLKKISDKTGYRFIFDEQWQDQPVTIALQDTPLEKGLKRILARFNHATVFEADNTIRIMIYEDISGSGATGEAPSLAARSAGRISNRDRVILPARQPPPPPRPGPEPEPQPAINPEDFERMSPAEAQAAFMKAWEAGQGTEMINQIQND